MELSQEKSEKMSFSGQELDKSKINVGNKRLQQVRNFKYLGCKISYEDE